MPLFTHGAAVADTTVLADVANDAVFAEVTPVLGIAVVTFVDHITTVASVIVIAVASDSDLFFYRCCYYCW